MHKQFFILLSSALCFTEIVATTTLSKTSVTQGINKICQTVPGVFGISALHLENHQSIEINEHKHFPMASTYKIPIAAYCLSLLDSGAIDRNIKTTITKQEMRRFCFVSPGQQLSIKKLLTLMLEKSDNATSDIILKMVGGGNAVTRWLRRQNIPEIHIDRSTIKMCADFSGIDSLGDEKNCTVERYTQLLKNVTKKQSVAAAKRFHFDKRDTATPHSTVKLLEKLYQGKLISKQSTNFLLRSMLNYTRGEKRIIRFLPKRTRVWHKSGSMDGIVSDVGIIELPNGKGHLALAVFTNKSITHLRQREHTMARISKILFDYFVQKT